MFSLGEISPIPAKWVKRKCSTFNLNNLKIKDGQEEKKPSAVVTDTERVEIKPKESQTSTSGSSASSLVIATALKSMAGELRRCPLDEKVIQKRVQKAVESVVLRKFNPISAPQNKKKPLQHQLRTYQRKKRRVNNPSSYAEEDDEEGYVMGLIPWTPGQKDQYDLSDENNDDTISVVDSLISQVDSNVVNFEDQNDMTDVELTEVTEPVYVKMEAEALEVIENVEKVELETVETEDQDEDPYLNLVKTEEYCDLCGNSFPSIEDLLSHKKLGHNCNMTNQPEIILGDIGDLSNVDDDNCDDNESVVNNTSEDNDEMLVYPELIIKEEKSENLTKPTDDNYCEYFNEMPPESDEMEILNNQRDAELNTSNCAEPIVVKFESIPTFESGQDFTSSAEPDSGGGHESHSDISHSEKLLYSQVFEYSSSVNQGTKNIQSRNIKVGKRLNFKAIVKKPKRSFRGRRTDTNEKPKFGFMDIINKLSIAKKT